MNKNFNHFCDSSNDEQEYPKIRLQRTLTNTFFERKYVFFISN